MTRPTQTITVFDPLTSEELVCYGQQTGEGLIFYSEDGSEVLKLNYHAAKSKITGMSPNGSTFEANVRGIDKDSILESGIHRLEISTKTANRISTCIQAGKVRDVVQFTRRELLEKPGIGAKSVDELESALERKNLRLITESEKRRLDPKFMPKNPDCKRWLEIGIQIA